ncbi:elongation factor P maturation arginine rhamnosyltransferase EarP [Chitinivorax sp. B]|uniref:elongation factor P maturation arginine rhamnosyltransferase EarP n=1 Tax=Chitinivorax sp. B TaxID=2502235 RepID=UPI0010F4A92D|nr:elongation factor P maturation arginine rhamnosyltransferase EarP [Chitinivorax sp. B]
MQRWDIFCAVIDNFGDIGVCWRLARQLVAERGEQVRLWVDDLASFHRICPAVEANVDGQRVDGIDIRHWMADFPTWDAEMVADVVVEAFACELPATYLAAMAQRAIPPVWLNLEYLSAEDWVADCHGMASRHPRLPLTKYFFFPGFTTQSGGLLCETGLLAARAAFDTDVQATFWQRLNVPAKQPGELRISLFSYHNPAMPALLQTWVDGPNLTRLLVPEGRATEQLATWYGHALAVGQVTQQGNLIVQVLPFTEQPEYDRLLWACDINFVRGEDSFVRAQWAQRPFVWHIYPQADDAHRVKLDIFLDRYLVNLPELDVVRRCWHAWNGDGDIVASWAGFRAQTDALTQHSQHWACQLHQLGDLAGNLACFVESKL